MSDREQGWWSETLRDMRDRLQGIDDRLRAVENAFQNGIKSTLQNMDGVLEEMRDNQRDLQRRVAAIEERRSVSAEIRRRWLSYAGVALTAAGLMFTAMRVFG